MNAKEALQLCDVSGGPVEVVLYPAGEFAETILRALRLLAAAEANDGTSPETNRLSDEISRKTFAQESIKADDVFDALDLARTLEQRCTGLAARVAELEAEVDSTRINLKLLCAGFENGNAGYWVHGRPGIFNDALSAIDAARSKP